jgi:capsular exopolysaccharide synthesis family protein
MAEQQETLHFLDYWRVVRSRKEVILAVALLVILTGILVTYAMPKVYMASAIIAVKPEEPDVRVFPTRTTVYDPLFMRTQFEVIQSRPILEETVRKLNLTQKLGSAYGYVNLPDRDQRTVKLLGRSMRVQQYRDTNLIEIRIYLAEPKESAPQEAADVANTIAEVFRDQRAGASRTERERALRALQSTLQDQEKKVSGLQARVEKIRLDEGITVIRTPGAETEGIEWFSITQLEGHRRQTRVLLAEKESRLKQLMELGADQLIAAGSAFGDEALQKLVSEKRAAEVDLSRLLQSGIGSSHPKALTAQVTIDEIERKIRDQVEGLKTSVRVDYQTTRDKLITIEKELEDLEQKGRERQSEAYLTYNQASEDLVRAITMRDSLEARYLQEQAEQRIPSTIVSVVQSAQAPSRSDPVSPDIVLNMMLSVLLGIGSGLVLAYFIEYLDTSVKTVDEVERSMGIPVLGVIPQRVRPLADDEADAAHAEAYRILRTNLRFSKRLENGKTLTVTSGSAGEGKSLTLFNLAYVCARLGERVLVVDSDLHRPVQHKLAKVRREPGLANVLVGEASLDDAIVPTSVPNLSLMPSGRLASGHHGLLDTLRMKELLASLKERFDLILFDSPPITGVSDASLLAREMDGVLLVVQHRKHPKAVSDRAKAMVENVGGNLVGVVLNNINISRDYSYYYYGHYYSYAYTKTRSQQKPEQKKES